MKVKVYLMTLVLCVFNVTYGLAQEKSISGMVSDNTGQPLAGVNIIVKGTTTGTQTDFDGNYSINTSVGKVLAFSYLGFVTVEQTVGASNTINITMEEDASVLDEVIVTAQGIKREKKALGYAISEIAQEEIEDRPTGDVARILSGKASGVQITNQSGTSGSGTSVIIRGASSINGSNQALFVVDGVPFSSDTNAPSGGFNDGNFGSSRFLDLDPNNIETINVLKGLAASTLYGTAGRNGVILITTKSGSIGGAGVKKTEISVSQSMFFNEIASLPDYQDQYGGGFNQSFGWFFSNWGPAFESGGVDGFGNDPSFRPIGDPQGEAGVQPDGTLLHPYASSAFLNPGGANTGTSILAQQFANERYEWRPYNSVENFFRTGVIQNTSLNIRGGSQDGTTAFNVNFGHLDEEGFSPGNGLTRTSLSIGGRAQLSNKFTISGSLSFARTDVKSPPVSSSLGNGTQGLSVFGNVFFTPRNVDLNNLPFTIPENGGSIYYRNGNDIINPLWTVANAGNTQLTNRVYGSTSLSYEFNDNLNVTYRAGYDFYNERSTNFSNKNGVNFQQTVIGLYETWDTNVRIWDHFASINGSYDLSEDIGLNFVAGATSNSRNFERQGVSSTQQIQFGTLKHFNFVTQSAQFFLSGSQIETESTRNIVGVFGEASFDYNDYLFLTLSGRNDWVSNLPSENNNQFYPSVSASFLPTTAFEGLKSEKGINYLKIRAGLGQSAGFPSGFPVSADQVIQSTTGNGGVLGPVVTNTVSNFKSNPDLKPELISEFEVGFDTRLWNNRIDLSFSYFDRQTEDLIVNRPLAPSTGFTSTQENIGKVEGDGFEIDLGIDLIKNSDNGFKWNSRVNFTKSEQIVTEQDVDQIVFGGFTNLGNAAIKGEQLGVIVGSRIERDDNGRFIVDSNGNYKEESQITLDDGRSIVPIIGNPQPDYVMNFINTLSYKNFNLGFQVSHTKGGDIYASTVSVLLGRGLIVTDRKNTFILPGIQETTGLENTKQINNSTFYFSNILFGPSELQVYDGSVVRLQEISFGYTFSAKMLEKTPFGSASITASGQNLWFDAYNTPDRANFDPNVAGAGVNNSRGFDFLNGPSSKRYGISLKVTF